jgi:hypothetical protein
VYLLYLIKYMCDYPNWYSCSFSDEAIPALVETSRSLRILLVLQSRFLALVVLFIQYSGRAVTVSDRSDDG